MSESETQSETSGFANPEAMETAVEARDEAAEAREQEAREAQADEKAIIDAIQEDTVTVRLKGRPLEFTILTGDEEDFIDDLAARFGAGGELDDVDDPDELDASDLEAFTEGKKRIIDILAKHNQDEGKYGRDFFAQLPMNYRFELINDIREGGEETRRAGNS